MYPSYFGGVVALSTPDFASVNGYSNFFWGWGAEDDDLFFRVTSFNFSVKRPKPVQKARYTSLIHRRSEPSPNRFLALNRSAEQRHIDGLADLNYRTVSFQLELFHTHIRVDLTPMKNVSFIHDDYGD